MSLQIQKSELNQIFPFHLVLSKNLIVESAGKSILKLFPEFEKDAAFFQCWQISRPKHKKITSDNFNELLGDLIAIEHKSKTNIQLKGHFEFLKLSNNYVFFGSPSFTSTDQLLENDLSINDFSLNDSLVDLLHVLKNNEIVNTELKEVLDKLNVQRRDLRLFKDIIDSSSDAIQVGYEDGQLFYVNEVASKRLGISMKECHKYKVQDFEKLFQMNPKAWDIHLKQLKAREYLTIEGENINQANGAIFPVEVTAKFIQVAGQGMVVGISRDISDRKLVENQLKRQEAKYRNIISNMNLGLLEVDNDDIIKFCNKGFEKMSGYNSNELIGKEAAKLFVHETSMKTVQERIESRKNGTSDSYEVKIIDKNKNEKWWLISGAPNFNDNGESIGSIGIHLDITGQKKLEAELEIALEKSQEAAKAKEAFLANMSHEIRTPLNAIIGTIRELGREKMTTKQELFLRHSNSAANHLLSIVNSILDMSKIESGELLLDEFDFSIEALFGNIESILRNKAERKFINFSIELDEHIFPAHIGDGPRLRQIFINLLDNAIKFTEKGGVKLSAHVVNTSKTEQSIQFKVSDTGIGMEQSYLDDIFKKFTQEQRSTSRKYGGTGLGMPITYEITQLMGGKISIQSTKGEGTEFTLDLSLKEGDLTKLTPKKSTAEKNALLGTQVLLVEDNDMNRFIALQSLQFLGCLVEEAKNGLIAVEKVKNNTFDIVLMDIQMPEMDGVMATQHIRKNLKNDVPIIAVTANAFKEDIDLYMSVGMNDYVTKPFEEYRLYEAIANLTTTNKKINKEPLQEVHNTTYNLEKLRALSHGNEGFVHKMVSIFSEKTPESLMAMNLALEQKNYIQLSKIAHKIKPSIDNMGIHRLDGKAAEIEKECKKENINHHELSDLVTLLTSELNKTLTELKENMS